MWKFVAGECGKRGMGIGLSGYTLDWPNGKSLISRTIYCDPEIQGREIAVARKQRVVGRRRPIVACDLPADTVAVRAYPGAAPTGLGARQPSDLTGGGPAIDRLDWTARRRATGRSGSSPPPQARHAQPDSSAGRAAGRREVLPAVPGPRPGPVGRGAELLLPRRTAVRRRRPDLGRRPGRGVPRAQGLRPVRGPAGHVPGRRSARRSSTAWTSWT